MNPPDDKRIADGFEQILRAGLRHAEREHGIEGLETTVAPLAMQGAAAFLPGIGPAVQALAPVATLFNVIRSARQNRTAVEKPAAAPVQAAPVVEVES